MIWFEFLLSERELYILLRTGLGLGYKFLGDVIVLGLIDSEYFAFL